MLDCNRLKVINDEYGHQHGDDYLRCSCRAICRTFAHSPVYRIGGDEFAVLLEGQDYVNRDELLKEFARVTEQTNAATSNPWEKVDVSLGMAVFDSVEDGSAEHVLHRADELMYLEKRLYKLARTQS